MRRRNAGPSEPQFWEQADPFRGTGRREVPLKQTAFEHPQRCFVTAAWG